MLLTK